MKQRICHRSRNESRLLNRCLVWWNTLLLPHLYCSPRVDYDINSRPRENLLLVNMPPFSPLLKQLLIHKYFLKHCVKAVSMQITYQLCRTLMNKLTSNQNKFTSQSPLYCKYMPAKLGAHLQNIHGAKLYPCSQAQRQQLVKIFCLHYSFVTVLLHDCNESKRNDK